MKTFALDDFGCTAPRYEKTDNAVEHEHTDRRACKMCVWAEAPDKVGADLDLELLRVQYSS